MPSILADTFSTPFSSFEEDKSWLKLIISPRTGIGMTVWGFILKPCNFQRVGLCSLYIDGDEPQVKNSLKICIYKYSEHFLLPLSLSIIAHDLVDSMSILLNIIICL